MVGRKSSRLLDYSCLRFGFCFSLQPVDASLREPGFRSVGGIPAGHKENLSTSEQYLALGNCAQVVDADEVMATVEHAFTVEKIKRSIKNLQDVDELRRVAIELLNAAESMRHMLLNQMEENMQLSHQLDCVAMWMQDDEAESIEQALKRPNKPAQ